MSEVINPELLEAFFEDAREVLEEWERVTLKLAPTDGPKAYEPILRCAHNLKGSAGMTGLAAFHAKLHRLEDYLVQLRDKSLAPNGAVVGVLLDIEHLLRRWVSRIKFEPHSVEDTKELEARLGRLVSEESSKDRVALAVPGADGGKDQPELRPGEESLRVGVNKLDHLIQLVGEISLHQSIIERASREGTLNTPATKAVIDLKTKLTQDLQDAALSLRMIPVAGLFQKIERVVRETAHRLNKQVQIIRKGEEVTLDKLVVEGMLDPLIHIARNAVDHGVESVVERVQKGKNPHGEIFISAENTAAGVTILFTDDGNGIDGDRVMAKAKERGLIAPDQQMDEADKLQLIFLPGLSTAESVTEFSGRGVGMDVVADSVKKMGGRVNVTSTIGQGTRLTVTLPTNFSILDALVVKVAGGQYAIPTQDLAEVIDLGDFKLQSFNGGEGQAIDLRGRIVPVEEMVTFLDQKHAAKPTLNQQHRPGIVIDYREDKLAFAIDAVISQQQVFVRPLIGHLAPIGFYSGSTILSDGEPTIILNLPEMAKRYFTSH